MSVSDMKARFRAAQRPMISVHRGLWSPAPENSCSAIQAGAAWDVVEVDVRLDGDGRAFFMHDQTLLRTTGLDVAAHGVDPFVLRNLKLRSGGGGATADMTSEPVPWLSNGFSGLDGTNAIFDLDVKRPEDLGPVAREVADLGECSRATLKTKVASPTDIAALKELEVAYGVMVMAKLQLTDKTDLDTLKALKAADVAVVEVKYASLDLLAAGCAIGGDEMRLSVLTLDIVHNCDLSDSRALEDPEAIWGRLRDAGVGLIMTDQPEALSGWLVHEKTRPYAALRMRRMVHEIGMGAQHPIYRMTCGRYRMRLACPGRWRFKRRFNRLNTPITTSVKRMK